jgi:hypothetical protein
MAGSENGNKYEKGLRAAAVQTWRLNNESEWGPEQSVALIKTNGASFFLARIYGHYEIDILPTVDNHQLDPNNQQEILKKYDLVRHWNGEMNWENTITSRRFCVGDEKTTEADAVRLAQDAAFQFWREFNYGPNARNAEKLVEEFEYSPEEKDPYEWAKVED